jgi:hypothetical protein
MLFAIGAVIDGECWLEELLPLFGVLSFLWVWISQLKQFSQFSLGLRVLSWGALIVVVVVHVLEGELGQFE